MGLSQGILSAKIAQLAPSHLRTTSLGLFHLTTGFMQLLAGVGFRWLWYQHSAATAFAVASLVSMRSLLILALSGRPLKSVASS